MEIKKLIEYLTAQGKSVEQINIILSNIELRNEMIKMINEYEETIVRNGFPRSYALENYITVQRMANYYESKKQILSQ